MTMMFKNHTQANQKSKGYVQNVKLRRSERNHYGEEMLDHSFGFNTSKQRYQSIHNACGASYAAAANSSANTSGENATAASACLAASTQ
jgi:hypothetical protein